MQLRSKSVSEIFLSFDKWWNTMDEITINSLCIDFNSARRRVRFQRFWFWKSQLKFWLLLATCWVWREMRLTLAFSSCCCLKIGSAGMYYFYATRCTTYQLPWYAFRVRSSLKIAFMCTTWTISSHSPTCRISLIAAILTDFKQVLALTS